MDLFLTRLQKREDGIFGELTGADDYLIAMTLEHAYPDGNLGFIAKVPSGEYLCNRGVHQLHGMAAPFWTFEITGVPGHTNILFHAGNFNADSAGCVLLGEAISEVGLRPQMITNSRETFQKFMDFLANVNCFMLTVSDQKQS